MEMSRLLLADRPSAPEYAIIQRWVAAVEAACNTGALWEASSRAEEVSDAPLSADDFLAVVDPLRQGSSSSGPPAAVDELVVPFVAHIGGRMLEVGGLRALALPAVTELCTRALLPLVEPILVRTAMASHASRDAQLRSQQKRMRNLTPAQLEVEAYVRRDEHGAPDLVPLTEPLLRIAALCFMTSPSDYAMGVVGVVRALNEYCMSVRSGDVGADVLVPMMVLLIVHADLPSGYAMLQHCKAHLEPAAIRSECGYCLCTFEAAIEHVRCCGEGG